MAEYIDKDLAMRSFENAMPNGDIFDAIDRLPTVEVVRCEDCVYHYYAVDCAGMCKLGIGNALLDDDFCSRGIRKGGADMREEDDDDSDA